LFGVLICVTLLLLNFMRSPGPESHSPEQKHQLYGSRAGLSPLIAYQLSSAQESIRHRSTISSGWLGNLLIYLSSQTFQMSTVLSTLQAGSLRDLVSAVGSLATWKTLALILAIINLKNLPFVWHVSSAAGCTCTGLIYSAFEAMLCDIANPSSSSACCTISWSTYV
jgi:hypothetical protein